MLAMTALLLFDVAFPAGGVSPLPARTPLPSLVSLATYHAPLDCDTAKFDLTTRRIALNALVETAPERLPDVLDGLKRRPDGCGAPLRRDLLVGVHRHHGSLDYQRQARLFALDLAATDPDSTVRLTAMQILQDDKTDQATQALGRAARNAPTPTLRAYAVRMLAASGTRNALGEIRALYRSFPDSSTKVMAIVAVASDPEHWPWLLEIAGSEDESSGLRRLALMRALQPMLSGLPFYTRSSGNMGGTPRQEPQAGSSTVPTAEALGVLYKRLGDASELPLRVLVVQALARLAQQGDDTAVEELGRIVKGDADDAIRRQAVQGLHGSHAKRAVQLLSEIVAR